jgi:hypothetical protein
MGDIRRFHLFADLIARNLSPDFRIADVASGKGALQAALYQRGYRRVVSWDKRKRNGRLRQNYRYEYFDYRSAPRKYDAVVAMHPDEATDHCVLYAARYRVPAIICPCCVMPSGAQYGGARADYVSWMRHCIGLAREHRLCVTEAQLPMDGRNRVLICRPKGR